jgi:hypothetical protein
VDNSIKLKELQIINGALKKRDKGFKRVCLGGEGGGKGWDNSTPFKRRFVL